MERDEFYVKGHAEMWYEIVKTQVLLDDALKTINYLLKINIKPSEELARTVAFDSVRERFPYLKIELIDE